MGSINTSISPEIKPIKKEKYILGIIDPQKDFFSGGKWYSTGSDGIIGPINKLRFGCVDHVDTFITVNSYPPNHINFDSTHNQKELEKIKLDLEISNNSINRNSSIDRNSSIEHINQIVLSTPTSTPTHCVQDTVGQQIYQDLIVLKRDKIFIKGTYQNIQTYSAFGDKFDCKYENTGLDKWLKSTDTKNIILIGIGIDTCIGNTAKEAIKLGYNVHIILSCVCGFEKNSSYSVLHDLEYLGAKLYDDVDIFLQLCEIFAKN